MKPDYPDNIAVQSFDPAYFESLEVDLQQRLLDCMQSGLDNPRSEVGCYARHADDYDVLRPFFERVISRHHDTPLPIQHHSSWQVPADLDPELDISVFGLSPLSVRMRVGRNFADLPLTSAMNKDQRLKLENRMIEVFDQLQATSELGGTYVSLTPGHPNQLTAAQYQNLIGQHVMFKPMDGDPYLASAGIASDWPYGRGCYFVADHQFIVWVGEEDHLRIMCMQRGHKLRTVLDKLRQSLEVMENAAGIAFANSPDFGAITTCPTNLGTGMRASVHLQLPCLTADRTTDRVKQIATPIGLSIRGLGGEHTPIGARGNVDCVSPKGKLSVDSIQALAN